MEENKEVIEIKKVQDESQNENQKTDKKGLCIASMVLGIISLVFCCVWVISIPCAILAIIFGIIGIKSTKKGMAIAGLITGAIGVIISFVVFMSLVMFGVISGVGDVLDSIEDDYSYDDYYDDDYDYDYDFDYNKYRYYKNDVKSL